MLHDTHAAAARLSGYLVNGMHLAMVQEPQAHAIDVLAVSSCVVTRLPHVEVRIAPCAVAQVPWHAARPLLALLE